MYKILLKVKPSLRCSEKIKPIETLNKTVSCRYICISTSVSKLLKNKKEHFDQMIYKALQKLLEFVMHNSSSEGL